MDLQSLGAALALVRECEGAAATASVAAGRSRPCHARVLRLLTATLTRGTLLKVECFQGCFRGDVLETLALAHGGFGVDLPRSARRPVHTRSSTAVGADSDDDEDTQRIAGRDHRACRTPHVPGLSAAHTTVREMALEPRRGPVPARLESQVDRFWQTVHWLRSPPWMAQFTDHAVIAPCRRDG